MSEKPSEGRSGSYPEMDISALSNFIQKDLGMVGQPNSAGTPNIQDPSSSITNMDQGDALLQQAFKGSPNMAAPYMGTANTSNNPMPFGMQGANEGVKKSGSAGGPGEFQNSQDTAREPSGQMKGTDKQGQSEQPKEAKVGDGSMLKKMMSDPNFMETLSKYPFMEQMSPEMFQQFMSGSSDSGSNATGEIPAIGQPTEIKQSANGATQFAPNKNNIPLSEGYTDGESYKSGSYLDGLSNGLSLTVPVQYGMNGPQQGASPGGFDVHAFRKDFPILHRKVHGNKDLVWLDNGATTQKPMQVIQALYDYYHDYNSNIHRGAHQLAAEATDAYEEAREKIRKFIGAPSKDEVIFLRGTSEGMNLIANTYGEQNVGEGDEIMITELEHHANIVPWQMLAQRKNAKLVVVPTDDNGDVDMIVYPKLFSSKTKLCSFTQASNAIGSIPPIKEMIRIAHSHGVRVVVDGAQSVQHMPVNVVDLDADFFVFSGHKIFAPMGIGVVWGRADILRAMPPWQGGGAMIKDVTFDKTEFSDIPTKFEAGTPNVGGPIGLGMALDYLTNIGMANIEKYEHELTDYGVLKLKQVPGLKMVGNPKNRIGVLSFVLEGVSNQEIGKALDKEGIAVRVGHHCAQPILRKFGYETVVRPSLAFYNTKEEIDFLVEVLQRIEKQNGGR
tara:strand:+ start:358 stop:2367 length:2010 start_codon:yes stop_codon:yes gene_type:complete